MTASTTTARKVMVLISNVPVERSRKARAEPEPVRG
jgi:hypothetical protein